MDKKTKISIIIFIIIITAISAFFEFRNDASENEEETTIEETSVAETTTEETTIEETTIVETAEPDDDEFVKVIDYIPTVVEDLVYATDQNFTGQVLYNFSHVYLRYGTVKKLAEAAEDLYELGYLIKIWDGFRPYEAQVAMWEAFPDSTYVANPSNGYVNHNYGSTIDMTIVTLDGEEVEMPSDFDDFTTLCDRDYSDVSEEAAENSEFLESIMIANGFTYYSSEWWEYRDTVRYETYMDFYPSD